MEEKFEPFCHVFEGISVQDVFEIGHEDLNCPESGPPREPPVAQVCPNSAYPKAEILRCGRGLEFEETKFLTAPGLPSTTSALPLLE
ncbi:hypothetical protein AB0V79_25220 [Mesorhizobium ciceri]|uniref:hypothetical protein n=1 Tax=Mesorhizobium TaxID=68287 RepID=UPI0007A94FFA|nr:hypothetical protein [Mesorhizobium ciceri]AMX98888.1 hypothetical protein A4R29_04785 [Mesorhizobium ciceri biovar biserrulae]